jgi:hypothetical protein
MVKLNHPNLVQLYFHHEATNYTDIVMQRCHGSME